MKEEDYQKIRAILEIEQATSGFINILIRHHKLMKKFIGEGNYNKFRAVLMEIPFNIEKWIMENTSDE